MFKRSLWLTASLPVLAAARNCTIPAVPSDKAVGWQPGGCYRGTWSIISNCLLTIFACTWTIQHLNIPAQDDSIWKKTGRKIKWMIITVLFPELVMIHAVFEFYMAWKALQLMSKNKKPVEWPLWFRYPPLSWLTFCRRYLQTKKDLEGGVDERCVKAVEERPKWTLVHCYFANMGGFIYTTEGQSFPATAQQLVDSSYIYPETKLEEIEDKSKQDWLAKIFAALQILQLILSIITRRIQGLQFSQLETVTLSFAICGVLIYCTYFYKPQGIGWPIDLNKDWSVSNDASQSQDTGTQATVLINEWREKSAGTEKVASKPRLKFDKTYESFSAIIMDEHSPAGETDRPKYPKRIPNDNIPKYDGKNDVHPAVYLLALASGLFGAIHAIAWYFEFPTEVEKQLWHIATIISATSPVVGLLAIPLAQLTQSSGDNDLFMGNCLRLMQQYSWHAPNNLSVRHAIKELEHAFATGERKRYSTVFLPNETDGDKLKLILDLQNFLELKGHFRGLEAEPFDLHKDELFIQNVCRLGRALDGDETKKIQEAAWTDTWPRKPLLPHEVNQGVLYITCFLYCTSRLILLGVSLSSLRKMPGSVYMETNWTQYLPAFGAGGG